MAGMITWHELFTTDVWSRYDRVAAGVEGWEDQLATWDVRFVVVLPTDTAFASRLVDAGWTELYRDADGAVYTRV